jgi:hypothetical protein
LVEVLIFGIPVSKAVGDCLPSWHISRFNAAILRGSCCICLPQSLAVELLKRKKLSQKNLNFHPQEMSNDQFIE